MASPGAFQHAIRVVLAAGHRCCCRRVAEPAIARRDPRRNSRADPVAVSDASSSHRVFRHRLRLVAADALGLALGAARHRPSVPDGRRTLVWLGAAGEQRLLRLSFSALAAGYGDLSMRGDLPEHGAAWFSTDEAQG